MRSEPLRYLFISFSISLANHFASVHLFGISLANLFANVNLFGISLANHFAFQKCSGLIVAKEIAIQNVVGSLVANDFVISHWMARVDWLLGPVVSELIRYSGKLATWPRG